MTEFMTLSAGISIFICKMSFSLRATRRKIIGRGGREQQFLIGGFAREARQAVVKSFMKKCLIKL